MIHAVLIKQFLLQMGAHVGGVDGHSKGVVLAKIIYFCVFITFKQQTMDNVNQYSVVILPKEAWEEIVKTLGELEGCT